METHPIIAHKDLVKEAFMQCFSAESDVAREQLLAQLESDNPAIAAEVKSLLKTSKNAGAVEQIFGFAANESLDATSGVGPQNIDLSIRRVMPDMVAAPGMTIGPYKLLEQIGEGGMGSVFMAQQSSPIKRRVALKVIKPGMDSQHVVARFEAERQALAMMDHSNIAKVLDAGTTQNGLPYFVMELVKGIPITEYCELEKLTIKDRLKLFVDLCRGVQHAHQKGIIHRDLKPSNVLVTLHDGKPVVKIIDFGIAKAMNQDLTDRTLFTQFAQMIGTPLYMSPEQAALSGMDVDTRSDVYSLGVLLYELLTGTTPFDKALLKGVGIDEVRRMIRETEPPRPSQRLAQNTSTLRAANDSTLRTKPTPHEVRTQRELQGELDWIVMKALEKERNRRYESASDFAADITRYLNNEQVQACSPSPWYRISKYVRRNRVLLATSSLITAALLAGLTLSLWQAVRATRAEQMAIEGSTLARQAVDEMYTEVAEQWLAENNGLTLTQRQFLDKALHFYKKFSEEKPSNVNLQIQRLQAMGRVAKLQARLGDFTEAEATNTRLIDEASRSQTTHPYSCQIVIALASAHGQLGVIQQMTGRENEAKKSLEQSFAILEPSLSSYQTHEPSTRKKLAESLQYLTTRLNELGLRVQAQQSAQKCVLIWKSLVIEEPKSWENRFGAANALLSLGIKQMWWGDQKKEAESVLADAESRLVALLTEQPTSRKGRSALSTVYQNLGVLNTWKGNNSEDLNFFRKSLALAESLARDYPMDFDILKKLNQSQGNVASAIVNHNLGKRTEQSDLLRRERMDVLRRLCSLYPEVIENQTQFFLIASWNLHYLCKEKKFDEAKIFSEDCLRWIGTLPLPAESNYENAQHLRTLNILYCSSAMVYLESGNYVEAALKIQLLPKQTCIFDENLVTRVGRHGLQRTLHYLIDCNSIAMLLQRPAEILKQCAVLAQQDAALSSNEKTERARSYLSGAKEFEAESKTALASFSKHAREVSLGHKELKAVLFKIYDENLMRNGFKGAPFAVENRLVRTVTLRNSRELIELISNLPKATDSLLVALLTAGPEELRDGDLALKLARNGQEKDPKKGMSKQDYAWALFRTGKYQECYEQLVVSGDPENGSILAMSLWQMGRHEEAKAWMDKRYEEGLAAYLERRKTDPAGELVWPMKDMLLRLDVEARTMLGLDAKTW